MIYLDTSALVKLIRIEAESDDLTDWLDDRSLWTSAAEVSPGSARVHNNLGHALLQIPDRLQEAVAHRAPPLEPAQRQA